MSLLTILYEGVPSILTDEELLEGFSLYKKEFFKIMKIIDA